MKFRALRRRRFWIGALVGAAGYALLSHLGFRDADNYAIAVVAAFCFAICPNWGVGAVLLAISILIYVPFFSILMIGTIAR